MMLPLTLAGVGKGEAEERSAEMLALVGLGVREILSARALRRHADARLDRARAGDASEILLMDEPFAALDEITRHKLNDDLLGLWWQNRFTAVFVTHSVFELVYLSQRIVVMAARPGRVMADLRTEHPIRAMRCSALRPNTPISAALPREP